MTSPLQLSPALRVLSGSPPLLPLSLVVGARPWNGGAVDTVLLLVVLTTYLICEMFPLGLGRRGRCYFGTVVYSALFLWECSCDLPFAHTHLGLHLDGGQGSDCSCSFTELVFDPLGQKVKIALGDVV